MTTFRIVTQETTFLNDGGPAADFGKKVTTEHWVGVQRPSQDLLGSIASTLSNPASVVYREVLPPGNDTMMRDFPMNQFNSSATPGKMLVQRKRRPKVLGWKTIRSVALNDLINEHPRVVHWRQLSGSHGARGEEPSGGIIIY